MTDAFKIGIEFGSILDALSKQIYDTHLAFIRENVQNAVDAVRMQAARAGATLGDDSLEVTVLVDRDVVEIRDNGIGMTLDDLRNLFWTMGASGKRTPEARAAGCVGMFGIGGFANFGVCSTLSVTSQVESSDGGFRTHLSRADIENSGGAIPEVKFNSSEQAAPRGTVVEGILISPAKTDEIAAYLTDFVRYADEPIYLNGELVSRQSLTAPRSNLRPLETSAWSHGNTVVSGQLYESADNVLFAELSSLEIGGTPTRLRGWVAFENGVINVLKRGFKLCATSVGTQIGVSGSIDTDILAPTAGRDSLDPESSATLASIVAALERGAVLAVLDSAERIAQHTRIFRYVRAVGLIGQLGNTPVELADGSETTLDRVRLRSQQGIKVYYAASGNKRLAHFLQSRGHTVVQLPYDSHKQIAVRDYLTTYCQAEQFDGRVECSETYENLTRFEKLFLSELEETILSAFEVGSTTLVPGRLTEDIPVFAADAAAQNLTIFVDVRHAEVAKLEGLGMSSLFHSMVAAFVREYLGPILKMHSPRFFGSGALNLDFLSKRRSELWVLVNADIGVFRRDSQRQVVRTSDVRVVRPGELVQEQPRVGTQQPKLIRIEGSDEFSYLLGYYLRVPASAATAYGDVIQQCDDRAAVWAGNKILFVASDGVSTAFQFEVRLDRLITTDVGTVGVANGAVALDRPVQALFDGLYFPIPESLEPFLVPTPTSEVRIEVRCDWIDFTTARSWEPAAGQ